MVLGLGTVIYRVSDLGRARTWYAAAFQHYSDAPAPRTTPKSTPTILVRQKRTIVKPE